MAYPFKKYNYRLTIDGAAAGSFSEVSAADVSCDPIEYREGYGQAVKPSPAKPGLIKYGNVTLKWGVINDASVLNWIQQTASGMVERKAVTIELLDDAEKAVASWSLANAWPVKCTMPDRNIAAAETPVESLELATEGLERVK